MKLLELRKSKGITQQEIANILGINNVTYYGYEKGRTEPNLQMLIKIADFYGVSLDYLCEHKTRNQLDIGYLTDMQKATVLELKQLNESNLAEVYGYINGLLVKQ